MPISADRFEEIDEEWPSPGTNAHEVLSFLSAHPGKAFTRSEVAERTDLPDGSVGPTLVRLREDGQVDHRGRYWRVSDHVRAVDAATGHGGEAAAAREDDPPDRSEWVDHAVDPRDERE
jgi:DNA-binding transcriptional ArsR family regulator